MDESSYPLSGAAYENVGFLRALVRALESRAHCSDDGRCFGCMWIHAVQEAAEAQGLAEEDVWADD